MQLKTDTLQGTGYKFSLNYSQSIQKERQISKQNNTKSDTKDVYILEDSVPGYGFCQLQEVLQRMCLLELRL